MSENNLIANVFDTVNSGDIPTEFLGEFEFDRKVVGGELRFYKPAHEVIERITLKELEGTVRQMTIIGQNIQIRISDLAAMFGKYQSGYNFRDDYTLVVFDLSQKSGRVNKILCEIHGRQEDLLKFIVSQVTFEF